MEQELSIEVQRDGQRLGCFTVPVVLGSLSAGELRPDDLAWHEGLQRWMMLKSLLASLGALGPTPDKQISNRSKSGRALFVAAFIAAIFLLVVAIVFIANSKGRQDANSFITNPISTAVAETPDPFQTGSIVYVCVPNDHLLGDRLKVAVAATNYSEAYSLMREENDVNYKVAVSLGQQLFNKDHIPDLELKGTFAKYVLDKHEQSKLLFLPANTKMEIIRKAYMGDPSCWSIYECKVLEPGSEGMILYVQEEYLHLGKQF